LRLTSDAVRLQAPTLVLEAPGILYVNLKLHDGAPAADADVLLFLHDPSLRFDDDPPATYHSHGRSDATGVAQVDGVLLRAYQRIALGVRLGDRPRQWIQLKKGVELLAEERRMLATATLVPYATVSGVVRAAASALPVALCVAAAPVGSPSLFQDLRWVPVDEAGRFTLEDCVLPESLLWIASQEPGALRPEERLPILTRRLDARGGHTDVGTLQLPPLETLQLEVLDGGGGLLEAGWVSIRRTDDRASSGPTVPIVNGRASLPHAPSNASFRVTVYRGTDGLDPKHEPDAKTFVLRGTSQVHVLVVRP
jgi:hypothetical protein